MNELEKRIQELRAKRFPSRRKRKIRNKAKNNAKRV